MLSTFLQGLVQLVDQNIAGVPETTVKIEILMFLVILLVNFYRTDKQTR